MQVIGHEAVGWTPHRIMRGGVEEDFAEGGVKGWGKPSAGAVFQGVRPENDGVALIMVAVEAGEVAFGIQHDGPKVTSEAAGRKPKWSAS